MIHRGESQIDAHVHFFIEQIIIGHSGDLFEYRLIVQHRNQIWQQQLQ